MEENIMDYKPKSAQLINEQGYMPKSAQPIDSGNLLPKFSIGANQNDTTTITPNDIVAGTMPFKGMRAISTGLADKTKQFLGTQNLSEKPFLSDAGILPINPVNKGAILGSRLANPRQIANTAIDVATSPETYATGEAINPGILSKVSENVDIAGMRNIEGIAQKLKIPKSAIDSIKTKGIDAIQSQRQSLGETLPARLDNIVQRMQEGHLANTDLANTASNNAFNSTKRKYIDTPTFKDILTRETTNATDIAQQNNPATKQLKTLYETIVSNPLRKSGAETGMGWKLTPQEMKDTRDVLSHLYNISGGNPIRGTIQNIKNALFDDAEASGMAGLQGSKAMQAKSFEMEPLIKKFSNPNTIGNYHNLSGDDKAKLDAVIDYIGDPTLKEHIDSITTGNYLDKIQQAQQVAHAKNIKTAGKVAKGLLWTAGGLYGLGSLGKLANAVKEGAGFGEEAPPSPSQ